MGCHHRLDSLADNAEEVAVVDAGERRGPGRHPPQLLTIDVPHDPHVVEAGETLLKLPGGDRSGCLAAEPGADVEIGEERGRREDAAHARDARECLPHVANDIEPLRRPDG